MPRIFDDLHEQNDAKTRRKLLDQRRMAYRRAIESYTEQYRLERELADYPDLLSASSQQAEQSHRHRAA
ncbi:MAG: transcriptional regulator [Gammaproteobacteria bacterium]|nr:transcriptional regulator [Gammaproteobacteria bacterium]MBU2065371.1 transcriptional regulator [Gammaproteobacteria bacterium]MBU2138685.1 transcriptional regulator [Gammaproteobacteria bacterium]MBU2216837.1 transcriptional regulator [Gammaproteobacteria bacterium]